MTFEGKREEAHLMNSEGLFLIFGRRLFDVRSARTKASVDHAMTGKAGGKKLIA
jgi:hypothetical protein